MLRLTCVLLLAWHCHAQLSVMFGSGVHADNCKIWGPWGPCIWVRSNQTRSRSGSTTTTTVDPTTTLSAISQELSSSLEEEENQIDESFEAEEEDDDYEEEESSSLNVFALPRWERHYFDQLRPGKLGCRNHLFYRIIKKKWGDAFNNVFVYLKNITIETEPCGMCSYQQSCGQKCHRNRVPGKTLNHLFVAERLCRPEALDGHRQDKSCFVPNVSHEGDCQLWPAPQLELPNLTKQMKTLIYSFEFLSCIPWRRRRAGICRCCCHPYKPDPDTFECVLANGVSVPEHLRID